MKHVVPLSHSTEHAPRPLWLPILTFLLVLTLVGISANVSKAGDNSAAGQPGVASSVSEAAAEVVLASPIGEMDETPTVRSGDTIVYLPLIRRSSDRIVSRMGVQVYGLSPTVVDRLDQTGTTWIRIPVIWSQIEPQNTTPEEYLWPTHFDEQLAQLTAKGIKVIFTLWGNPSWAATYPSGPIDLVDISELVEFLQAAVAHYGAAPYYVKHWEMYNEPDNVSAWHALNGGWGYFGNDPAAYVRLLAAVYGPMKAVDPEAQIVFGGIAHDGWTSEDPPGHFAEDFVDGVLQNGGGNYFDVMNFHYYIAFRHKWDPYGLGIMGKATALREKLASYGVHKPLICTETSMWSDELHGGSNELQTRYIAKVFARSMAADLKTTIWFMLSEEPDPDAWKYGLVDANLNPKPAYYAYQATVEQLAPTNYLRTLSTAETGSEQIEAYEFETQDGSLRLVVAWTNDQAEHVLTLDTDQILAVDKFGQETIITDGDDGTQDGRTHVSLGPNPQYLRFQP